MKGLKAPWRMLFLAIPCLMILLTSAMWAQLYTGTVTGVITDPSGAVVPKAEVKLLDELKGFVSTTTTDPSGGYLFRSVPPGTYKVSVKSPGFTEETRSDVKLDVGQNVTANFSLQLGMTAQSVEVTGGAPLLHAQDAVVGQVVNRELIDDLPLIGRSFSNLAFLSPGITEADTTCPAGITGAGSSGGNCPANNFISDGSRNSTSDFLIDGVTTSNFFDNNVLIPTYTPSIDSVEEFAVQGGSFSAEYGFSGSTIINVVTRSGTNKFHGAAYDFLRNRALDANNFFSNEAGLPVPALRLNNFGGTIGGPIKRDKTFFFFDYDGTREATLNTTTAGVPSAAEHAGDFSELCTRVGGSFGASGMCSAADGQLWDPYTGVYDSALGGPVRSGFIPFNNMATYQSPGNPNLNGTGYQLSATPGNLIDPIASKYMKYLPLPNFRVGTSAYNPYTNWEGSPATITRNDQYDIKIDHRFSDRDLLSVKYSRDKNSQPPFPCYSNTNPADPCTAGTYIATAHLIAISDTHTFSPTLLMTVSYGLTRGTYQQHQVFNEPQFKGISPSATVGMPQYMDRSGVPDMPLVNFGGYSIPTTEYGSTNGQLGTFAWCCGREGQEAHNLLGMLSWVKGNHSLKFGPDARMHRFNYTLPGTPSGLFAYDFTSTSQFPFSGGGDAIASYLTGVGGPGAWGQYEVPNFTSTQTFQFAGFVQDDWKVSKRLTLNIGLRYEVDTPQTERYNRMNELDPNVASPLQVPGLGTLHGGEVFMTPSHRNQYNIDWANYGPRLGVAYQASNKTVIRGGYGIYYIVGNIGPSQMGAGFQGFDQVTPWITSYQNDHTTPWGRFSDPYPIVGPQLPVGNSLGLLNEVGFGANAPIRYLDAVTPYEQAWNLGVQRELPSNVLLDVSYVAKKGTHLLFGGGGNYDVLGPQIEKYSSDQITGLNTYVTNPLYGIITNPNSALSSPQVPAWQLQLPYPQFTGFAGEPPPVANSIYSALQIKLEKRVSKSLQFLVTYTWSKSIDNSSGNQSWIGGLESLQDPNNLQMERGLSSFDLPHILQFSYTYRLPVGRGKALANTANPVVNAIIGGWQTVGLWRFNDGRPIALSLQGGQSLPTYGAQRPDLVGTLTCSTGAEADRLNNYFANPQVVTTPLPFALGTAPRTDGSCRQPGQANTNLSVFKSFSLSRLRDGAHLDFRLEAYNAFNHPQFQGPNVTLNSGSFGVITSQANSPRQAQAALKLYW
jgi:hypothetical protein